MKEEQYCNDRINDDEQAFAEKLFTLTPTPPSAKRFTNIYRMLKAPVKVSELISFEGTEQLPGDFQVPMLLLAILIGSSKESSTLFTAHEHGMSNGTEPTDALKDFKLMNVEAQNFNGLQEKVNPIVNDPLFPTSSDVYRNWLPRVARFSFDVGKVEKPKTPNEGREKPNGQPGTNNNQPMKAGELSGK